MFFASDNASPVPPEIMAALQKANQGYASAYGTDSLMDAVRARLRAVFEAPDAAVYLVATGTAANALSLACLCPPWGTVFCHRHAHIAEDECGAPEFFSGGGKLTLLDGPLGKFTAETLGRALEETGQLGVHSVQKGAVSITNLTEAGTAYSPAEIGALCSVAHAHGMPVHMDGARFANALVSHGCSPAELTWKAGIDVLSFGGTKNGLMGAEAVILFNKERAWEFELRRKRGGHLFSKHRYLSAQMDAYLDGNLWLDLARRANNAASKLAEGLAAQPDVSLLHPVDGNQIFAQWPRRLHQAAFAAGAAYYLMPAGVPLEGPEDEPLTARLVCSWSTSQHDISAFLAALGG